VQRFAALLLLMILILPLGGVAQGTESTARIVGADDHSLTLEIRRAEGRLERRELIAIPSGSQPIFRILEIATRRAEAAVFGGEGGRPAPGTQAAEHLSLGPPGQLRHLRFVPLEIRPVVALPDGGWSILDRAVVRVEFEPPAVAAEDGGYGAQGLFASLYEGAVLNQGQVRDFVGRPMDSGPGPLPPPLSLQDSRIRIEVTREGLYHVTPAWLASQGVDLDGGVPSNELKLTLEGAEVAIRVEDGGDGTWGAAASTDEWVEFYGYPRLGEDEAGVWERGDFTDTSVFWLSVDAAGPPARVGERDQTASGQAPLASFPWTVRAEEDLFFLGQSLGIGEPHWFWDLVYWDPAIDGNINPFPVTLPLPGFEPGCAGTLRFQLLGRTDVDQPSCPPGAPDHVAILCVGGTDGDCVSGGPSVVDERVWADFTLDSGVVDLPAGLLTDPVEIRMRVPLHDDRRCPNAVEFDIVAPDWFEVTYQRLPEAVDDALVVTPPQGPARVEVTGFTDAAAGPTDLWDVTDPLAPVAVRLEPADVTAGSVAFEEDFAAGSRYVVASGPGFLVPEAAREEAGPDLRGPQGADYLVIAAGEIAADPAGAQALADLLTHRTAMDSSLTTMLITIEAVLDQFGEGIYDPRALQGFLAYAFDNWDPVPAAVLLVGDASVDMKDNMGMGGAQVPTFLFDIPAFTEIGWYASDSRLGAVSGGDVLPDMLVGRLPVRVADAPLADADLRRLVDKLILYDTDASLAPPLGWRRRLIMSADAPETAAEQVFEDSQDAAADDLVGTPYDPPENLYWSTYVRPDEALLYRDHLVNALNTGALVWSFAGHGNHATLSDDTIFATVRNEDDSAFQPADLRWLEDPGAALPVLIHANCLTGQFMVAAWVDGEEGPGYTAVPLESMCELMVEKPDGGAIAAIAPAGLTRVANTGVIMEHGYWALINDPGVREPGTLWMEINLELYKGFADLEIAQSVLLGDPLTHLAVPGPSRVLALAATPGSRLVDLEWVDNDPSEQVQHYSIERRTATGSWQRIEASWPGTPYQDFPVASCRTYYYRVRAHDADGFAGPYSNEAEAYPFNPNPPAPPEPVTAVVGAPDSINVTWTSRPPGEEPTYYNVHYGPAPRPAGEDPALFYPYGKSLPHPIPGTQIQPVRTQAATFLCVDTTSICEITGPCSPELRVGGPDPTGTLSPWLPGLRVRRDDRDLRDVVLDWPNVVHDVWGGPKDDIVRYEIYRDTDAITMVLGAPTDIIDCGVGCPPDLSWTDTGAAALGGDRLVFYATPAVDSGDETSGFSHDLPRPVSDWTPSPGLLTWEEAVLDLRAARTPIGKYLIFGSDVAAEVERAGLRTRLPQPPGYWEVPGDTIEASVDAYDFYLVVAVDIHGVWSP